MKKVSDEVVFLCGQGNYQLSYEILGGQKCLIELFGQLIEFSNISYNCHPDGEIDNRIVDYEKIEGKVVVIFESMSEPEWEREALDLIWLCKYQYKAKYIIGVFPFLWNRRQDPIMDESEKESWSNKVAKKHEGQRLKQTIHLLKTCGLDEMIVATPHSATMSKECKNYGILFHEVDPSPSFAIILQTYISSLEERKLIRVYSPDAGSLPRAINLARLLNCPVLFNLKNRGNNNTTSIVSTKEKDVEKIIDDFKNNYDFSEIYHSSPELVSGNIIALVDDELASCGTVSNTGKHLKSLGAKSILLFATHGVLTSGWKNNLFDCRPFTKIILTNTVFRGFNKRTGGGIFDLSIADLFASAIFQILGRL